MNENNTLKRSFGMREAVTITVGTVVGVGIFTIGAQIVGIMGSSVILATIIAMIISIYPARLYAEMGAALPYAGGTYKYAMLGISRSAGVLAGWNFIISLIAVTSGEALAFSFYVKTVFRAFGFELPISDTLIACIAVTLFIITNIRGVEMTGKLQNGFMYFFWGVAVIWFLTMIPNVSLPNFIEKPAFLENWDTLGFIGGVAMIWWCFAGFETCCAMGEEIKYPHINIPRALTLAPFIIFAVNAIFQWYLVAIVPSKELYIIATADAPYAEAMSIAGVLGFPLALLAAGIAFGGDFSTLNASIAVPPRYLFAMARDGSMPKLFAKVHPKYKTPYVAIMILGILSVLLIATNSINYIASLSLFADLFYYIIGIAAALGLRYKQPSLIRPYKAPFIKIGVPISIIIYIIMMTQLNQEALITGIVWCILGLVIYGICRKKYGQASEIELDNIISEINEPPENEKIRMDKEYRRWSIIVGLAAALSLLIYIIPLI